MFPSARKVPERTIMAAKINIFFFTTISREKVTYYVEPARGDKNEGAYKTLQTK
jgi:hypothetical protein